MMPNQQIKLKKLKKADIRLVADWLEQTHVKKWYHSPDEWITEMENKDGRFLFIHHFLVLFEGTPIGFCQYYDCFTAKEDWYQIDRAEEVFSIDYLIGDTRYLHKGYGKQIIQILTHHVRKNERNAQQIIVQPEKNNLASCNVLVSNQYIFDESRGYFYYNIS